MADSLSIDVFWSFRSPWSYLATPRLRMWQSQYQLDINFRPVYPIAIRSPEFFHTVHPQWVNYFLVDLLRCAEFLDMPIAWPDPDPVPQYVDEAGLRQTAPEQPHIHRLTRLGIVAAEQGRGIEFADEVSRVIWGGTANWHQGDHLANAAERAGLVLADMDEIVAGEEARLEAAIEDNQQAHEAAGHWGVPTCVFNGEPFFGQDRLELLLWRLQQAGLQARQEPASS
jgi:2-hydroxychromene-2-carboxylate isomerase